MDEFTNIPKFTLCFYSEDYFSSMGIQPAFSYF